MILAYRLQRERADAEGTADANYVDLKSYLSVSEERIQHIIKKETDNDIQNKELKIAYIYQYIAFSDLTVSSELKLAMKFMSANKLLDMIKTVNHEQFDYSNVLIDMSKYACDNCTSLGAIYNCSRCKQAKYCSKSCQTFSWKDHKAQCASSS